MCVCVGRGVSVRVWVCGCVGVWVCGCVCLCVCMRPVERVCFSPSSEKVAIPTSAKNNYASPDCGAKIVAANKESQVCVCVCVGGGGGGGWRCGCGREGDTIYMNNHIYSTLFNI